MADANEIMEERTIAFSAQIDSFMLRSKTMNGQIIASYLFEITPLNLGEEFSVLNQEKIFMTKDALGNGSQETFSNGDLIQIITTVKNVDRILKKETNTFKVYCLYKTNKDEMRFTYRY